MKPEKEPQTGKLRRFWRQRTAALVVFFAAVLLPLPLEVTMHDRTTTTVHVVLVFVATLGLVLVRCPFCRKSPYVAWYLGSIPVLLWTWSGTTCPHCQNKLK